MKPRDFIGQKATYDAYGQIIWGGDITEGLILLDVRGWGAIKNLFDSEDEAIQFHDTLGVWFADAINEKLEREQNLK